MKNRSKRSCSSRKITWFIISNDIIKIIKTLGDSGVSFDGVIETVKYEIKK